ncbi:uncharacterized protein LOC124556177 [Schistocerca americana]|uniref:uncharacterized protein LOC124556177 n=1 Tax=Schistocerca americana TaxID=7009 RepID=UPI001F4FEF75|nr:uncharacterized protein LOC124556177 [Schistocerca americana]
MDASHWVVAFLLFTASQGTQQRLIVDDNAPFFDDFPGYRSTDDVSKNVRPRNPDDTSTTAPEALVQTTGALRSMEEHDATSLLLPGQVDVTTRRSNRNRTRLIPELQRFPLRLQELIARDTEQPYSTEP